MAGDGGNERARLLGLQRQAGNAAVAGLLRARARPPAAPPPLQRQAAAPSPLQREGDASAPRLDQPPAQPDQLAAPGGPRLPGSPSACLASAAMPAEQDPIARTSTGTVGQRFTVRLEWANAPHRGESSYCAAECGEYRQLVRGRMLASSNPDGSNPTDVSAVLAGGQRLSPTDFIEDALDGDPGAHYGHRDENQKNADQYTPLPRQTGSSYVAADFPSISTGMWAVLDLEFLGKAIDVCNGGKELSSNRWTVRYTGMIRPPAQRSTATGTADVPSNDSAGPGRLGPGRPLGEARGRMERALGAGLDDVRIHTDPAAAGMAGDLGAKAFTVGNDIGFAAGEFQPGTVEGDAVLAHELAHTLQQRDEAAPGPAVRTWAPGPAEAAEERDADRSAAGALARLWGQVQGGARGVAGQAIPQLRSGLRLRRCSSKPPGEKCCEGSTALDAGTLTPLEADHDCNPSPAARNDVFAVSKHKGPLGEHPTIYGETGVGTQTAAAQYIDSANIDQAPKCADKCRPVLPGDKPPTLHIRPFVYTKEGKYDELPRKGRGKCKGKMLPAVEVIGPELAKRIRQAEVEHCRDAKEAWRLTYGTYLAGVEMLRGGFCPDPGQVDLDAGPKAACQAEYRKALEKLTGFASSAAVQASFACLIDQSGDRDTKKWHTIKLKYTEKVAADCSGVELLVPEENQLPEVDKHPTSELMAPACLPGKGK